MKHLICFNGNFIDGQSNIVSADSGGLKYGDGLFETMRVEDEKIRLAVLHFHRLFEGLHYLQFDIPGYFTDQYLWEQILQLYRYNQSVGPARVRLTVFREHSFPAENSKDSFQYLLQSIPLNPSYNIFNEEGLTINICPGIMKSTDILSTIKSNNYLPYILAGIHARKTGVHDSLVINVNNRIADSAIANVFCIKGGLIRTPPLSEGCINGVMRKYLLKQLPAHNWSIDESPLTIDDIEAADEVFLTNALFGLRWVGKFGNTLYSGLTSRKIYDQVISTI